MVYEIDHPVYCGEKDQVPLVSTFTFVDVCDRFLFWYSYSTSFQQRFRLTLTSFVILVVNY